MINTTYLNITNYKQPGGFHKMNFDGASKGNPGPAVFGVVLVFCDESGQGHDTNNSAELWGLLRGIQYATQIHLKHLLWKGILKSSFPSFPSFCMDRLHQRSISPCCPLLNTLETIKSVLSPSMVLIPSHVWREANKVADKLANIGVTIGEQDICFTRAQHPIPPQLQDCFDMAQTDCQDAGHFTGWQASGWYICGDCHL